MNFQTILKIAVEQRSLTYRESCFAFTEIMQGHVSDAHLAAFLTALHMRGETKEELLGAVEVMCRQMHALVPSLQVSQGAIDVCGTGGDGLKTLNVSTAVAFVLAGLGVPVAKHGGRALSSSSGAADVLERLGIPPDEDLARQRQRLEDHHLVFLAAHIHHPTMGYAAKIRRELGFRTIFNLVGPLCNPAQVKRQLVGVFSRKWCEIIAEILASLGGERICVVYGETDEGGIDELTLAGKSDLVLWEENALHHASITPEMAGLSCRPVRDLRGGTPEENAQKLSSLLQGEKGCYHDTVLLNAAVALHVAGRGNILSEGGISVPSLRRNIAMASYSLENGLAAQALNHIRERRSAL